MGNIKCENIEKCYVKDKKILEDLNLDIKDGSFTILVGPSGCGKTTLLRSIAGLEHVTKGQIYIGDKNVTEVDASDRGIAMVFQNYALYPHMTVKKNIEFGLKNFKIPKEEIEDRITKVLNLVGLTEYKDTKPGNLSGGQRQRVALARAISKKPSVFLMDEPLSNLDAKLRLAMRNELIELHRKLKTTFLYVTHDQVEAMSMGTEIVVMNKGKIMQKGTPKEVHDNPDNIFVATFIGETGMSILKNGSQFIGIRAKDVSFKVSNEDEYLKILGEITTIQLLGGEYLYNVKTEYGDLQVKNDDVLNYGQKVSMYISREKVYCFDVDELRIRDENICKSIINKFDERSKGEVFERVV